MSKGRVRGFFLRVRVFVFKPDGIGDFVIATGALRTLATEYGEENLVVCVKSLLVPLAQSQFPRATIIDLPVAAKRKVINLFAWNLLCSLPVWWRLRRTRVDAAVCLRSMRNYLETFLFYSAKAGRFLACTNLLLNPQKKARTAVENATEKFFRAELVPYPALAEEVPQEIEAHRRVVSRLLGRELPLAAALPDLRPTEAGSGDYWICAPITNNPAKLYPPERWRDLFAALAPEAAGRKILLAGSEDQRGQLEEIRDLLHAAGLTGAELAFPPGLVAYMNLIAGAELVLTVDTAAAHFATALDRRCVVLFSAMHCGMFGPWVRSDRQAWLLPTPDPARKKFKWHKGISPERAAAAARRLLQIPG